MMPRGSLWSGFPASKGFSHKVQVPSGFFHSVKFITSFFLGTKVVISKPRLTKERPGINSVLLLHSLTVPVRHFGDTRVRRRKRKKTQAAEAGFAFCMAGPIGKQPKKEKEEVYLLSVARVAGCSRAGGA